MRFIGKWTASLIALVALLLAVPALQTSASTSKIFQDGTCKDDCFTSLYTAPNGNIYQLQYETAQIHALNGAGKKLWSYKFPKDHMLVIGGRSNQTIDANGNFYIAVENNSYTSANGVYLASINAKGKLNWKFKVDKGGPSVPLVDKDGTVYFGSGNHTDYIGPFMNSTFYAVSAAGKKKWSVPMKGDGLGSTPTFDSKRNIVIQTIDDSVWKYTISKTGKILSTKKQTAFVEFTDKSGNQYSLDYNTNTVSAADKGGKKLWSYQGKEYISLDAVSESGTVIVTDDGYTLSITKGKVNWKRKVAGTVVYNKYGIYVLQNDMDWNKNTGNLRIYLLDVKSGNINYSQTLDFYSFQFAVHPKGAVLVTKDRAIYKISFFKEQTDSLKTSQVKLANNKGKSDTVKISGVKKGDTIKVYNASTKGKLLATKKAAGSSATLSIKQLGKKAGKVYITITASGMSESGRTAVSFKAEKR